MLPEYIEGLIPSVLKYNSDYKNIQVKSSQAYIVFLFQFVSTLLVLTKVRNELKRPKMI